MKYHSKFIIFILLLGVTLAIWAFFVEPSLVKYRDYNIYLKKWSKDLSGFTIAFIADIHVGSPHITTEKLNEIVEKINAKKPDIILLGGDYVIQGVLGGTPVPSNDIAVALSKLNAPYGVFGILGNHDWWEDEKRMQKEFENVNITMLEDSSKEITVNDTSFWLVGISDYNEGAHNFYKALSETTNDKPIIALTHSPDIFPELPDNINLTLAGHTHGGQVYIPLLGRLIVPSKYGERYAIGLIKEGNKQLFVNSGIGTSILPVRFLTPPEVSFLHIYPKK